MKNLTYEIKDNKLLVKISFELKDLFKENFKSAKWESWNKCWELNNTTRTLNKLNLWLEEAKAVSEKIEAQNEIADEEELEGEKLQNLKDALARIEKKLDENKKTLDDVNEIIAQQKKVQDALNGVQVQLNEAEDKVAKAEEIKTQLLKENEKSLENIIDIDKAISIINELNEIKFSSKYNHLSHNKRRALFNPKKDELDDMFFGLLNINFTNIDLYRATYAYFNDYKKITISKDDFLSNIITLEEVFEEEYNSFVYLREEIARNTESISLQEKLSTYQFSYVKNALSKNENASKEILERLKED